MKKYLIYILPFLFVVQSVAQKNNIANYSSANALIYQFLKSENVGGSLDFQQIKNTKPDYFFADHAMYWGEMKEGKPDGVGIKYVKDSSFYIGEFSNGFRNGTGIKISNISLYIGGFMNDHLNGFGAIYIFKDSIGFQQNLSLLLNGGYKKMQEPEMLKGNISGVFSNMDKGDSLEKIEGSETKYIRDEKTQTITTTAVRKGKFIGGTLVGYGIFELEYANPESPLFGKIIYMGSVASEPSGNIVAYFIDKKKNTRTKYEGVFDNMFDFNGKRIESNGMISEGNFKNLELNGWGKQYDDLTSIEGNFVKNVLSGKGVLKYKEGSKYQAGTYFDGSWENGLPINGTFFNAATEEYIKGSLVNGELDGTVTINQKGKTTTAVYRQGQRQ
ncbi:MAG: hypothetical protein KA327_11370 [Pseudarcicella sp.]|nr:hypothetical protein [Pseudarcicella sp.]